MTVSAKIDYTTVTETWGLPASPEQLAMIYCRYKMAGDLAEGRRVLEIGCGSGMGLAYLQLRAAVVVGGDPSEALLAEARQHLPDLQLAQLDAQQLPFPNESFDVVLMLEVIYYIPDLDRAFAECRRVLPAGGHLMACLPNRDRPDFNPSPFSIRYPSAPELAQLFREHGFQPRIYGGFPLEVASARDRLLTPLRHFAVRHRLIPRSMRAKALLKRVLYGRLPRLGALRDGMAECLPPVELGAPWEGARRFKTLYAVGVATRG